MSDTRRAPASARPNRAWSCRSAPHRAAGGLGLTHPEDPGYSQPKPSFLVGSYSTSLCRNYREPTKKMLWVYCLFQESGSKRLRTSLKLLQPESSNREYMNRLARRRGRARETGTQSASERQAPTTDSGKRRKIERERETETQMDTEETEIERERELYIYIYTFIAKPWECIKLPHFSALTTLHNTRVK